MWEQTAQTAQQTPVIQRRSLPPNQQTRISQRQRQPTTSDTQDDDAFYPQRPPSSAIRYTDTQGNQVIQQGRKKIVIHHEPPPKRNIHWSLIFGIGMIVMLGLGVGGIYLSNWWTEQQLDATYGMPRTYQTDAIVYPGDSAATPSHYIFLNLNGNVQIIEEPHGDATHTRIYKGPTLFSDNAPLIPVTGEFKTVNGKIEMLIHIQEKTIMYVNDGTQFQAQH